MTGPRPAALLPAAVLIALEGVSALAYGVVEAFQTRSDRLVVGVGAAVLLVGYGIGLLVLARGVYLVRRWSRAPVVAAQLIQLPIAWSFRTGGTGWFAAALGLASVAVLVCLFLPSSTAALARHPGGDDDPDGSDGSDNPEDSGDGLNSRGR